MEEERKGDEKNVRSLTVFIYASLRGNRAFPRENSRFGTVFCDWIERLAFRLSHAFERGECSQEVGVQIHTILWPYKATSVDAFQAAGSENTPGWVLRATACTEQTDLRHMRTY